MYWSIISDYDFKTAILELVDNALDLWTLSGRKRTLEIDIDVDVQRQAITVVDNAGGVKLSDLHLLITPGGSRNDPDDNTIGVFGVGGKRASIALGEHVEIRTRYGKETSHQIDITKEWQDRDDWEIPAYSIPDIPVATTIVEISKLRRDFSLLDVAELRQHLSETYSWFLGQGCQIRLQDKLLTPIVFDHWAFPVGQAPREERTTLRVDGSEVTATLTAGLIYDRDPEIDNYGVYIYCNGRLISKHLRTREVGYNVTGEAGYNVTGEAGVPHPDASLCRVIVRLEGPARLMPWNSSKSAINSNHEIFRMLRTPLIQLVSHYSSLSRRLKHEWQSQVFSRTSGNLVAEYVDDITSNKRLNLPSLPKVNKPKAEKLKEKNKKVLKDKPWTMGLLEAIAAADVIHRQNYFTGNRIALILLDSDFEIGLKEFIVHRADLFPPSVYTELKLSSLFKNRSDVIDEVGKKFPLPLHVVAKAKHYYMLRNKLIHERATSEPTDEDIRLYGDSVKELLTLLFKLRF